MVRPPGGFLLALAGFFGRFYVAFYGVLEGKGFMGFLGFYGILEVFFFFSFFLYFFMVYCKG